MCLAPKAPAPPPPPAPIVLPKAETAPMVAQPQMQTAPTAPTRAGQTGEEQTAAFRRRGKRSMIIQMGSSAGTNIPGA